MTWVLVVWFWVGDVKTAPSMVSVPGFTSQVACEQAAVDMSKGLKNEAGQYAVYSKLYIKCEPQQ